MKRIYDLLIEVLGYANIDDEDFYVEQKNFLIEGMSLTPSMEKFYENVVMFAYPYLERIYGNAEFYIRNFQFNKEGLSINVAECDKDTILNLHDLLQTEEEENKLKEIYRDFHVNFVRRDKQILSNGIPVSTFNYEKQTAISGFANFSEAEFIRIQSYLYEIDLDLTTSRMVMS